eukprot:1324387-Rhodomonas_salina.1
MKRARIRARASALQCASASTRREHPTHRWCSRAYGLTFPRGGDRARAHECVAWPGRVNCMNGFASRVCF